MMSRKPSQKSGTGQEQAEGGGETGKEVQRSDPMSRSRKYDSSASTVADNSPDNSYASATKIMSGLFRHPSKKTSGDPPSPSVNSTEQPPARDIFCGGKRKK